MTYFFNIAIIIPMNKRIFIVNPNGTTYIYEDEPYWNKDKKRGEHKRVCIGKIDENGNECYNDFYKRREKEKEDKTATNTLVGERMILDSATERLGVIDTLNKAFDKDVSEKLLSLAYYYICTGKASRNAMDWLEARGMEELSSQEISDLLKIKQDSIDKFLSAWGKIHAYKDDITLFDITSISSYAQDNIYVERGYNRDKEDLNQINLAILSSGKSGIPIWYSHLPGSMSDRSVLTEVLDKLDNMGIGTFLFTGDSAFYGKRNISDLVKHGHGYLVPVPDIANWQKEMIDSCRKNFEHPDTLIEIAVDENITQMIYGKTIIRETENGKEYCHVYFDPQQRQDDIGRMMSRIRKCKDALDKGKTANTAIADKYLIKTVDKDGRERYEYNSEAISEYNSNRSGWWILVSNKISDKNEALRLYKSRNNAELHFDDLKNSIDGNRLRSHSEQTMRGKLLVLFIALALITELKNKVNAVDRKERKYRDWYSLLSSTASYSRIKCSGIRKTIYSTPTASQKLAFKVYEIPYNDRGKTVKPKPCSESS